jgi:hypothetical protein
MNTIKLINNLKQLLESLINNLFSRIVENTNIGF